MNPENSKNFILNLGQSNKGNGILDKNKLIAFLSLCGFIYLRSRQLFTASIDSIVKEQVYRVVTIVFLVLTR